MTGVGKKSYRKGTAPPCGIAQEQAEAFCKPDLVPSPTLIQCIKYKFLAGQSSFLGIIFLQCYSDTQNGILLYLKLLFDILNTSHFQNLEKHFDWTESVWWREERSVFKEKTSTFLLFLGKTWKFQKFP